MPLDDRDADVRSSIHRPRHAQPEPGEPTTVIPRLKDGDPSAAPRPPADDTAVIPRVAADSAAGTDRKGAAPARQEHGQATPARARRRHQPAARTRRSAAGPARSDTPRDDQERSRATPPGPARPDTRDDQERSRATPAGPEHRDRTRPDAPATRPERPGAEPARRDAAAPRDASFQPDATAVIPRIADGPAGAGDRTPDSPATGGGTPDSHRTPDGPSTPTPDGPRVDWWGRPVGGSPGADAAPPAARSTRAAGRTRGEAAGTSAPGSRRGAGRATTTPTPGGSAGTPTPGRAAGATPASTGGRARTVAAAGHPPRQDGAATEPPDAPAREGRTAGTGPPRADTPAEDATAVIPAVTEHAPAAPPAPGRAGRYATADRDAGDRDSGARAGRDPAPAPGGREAPAPGGRDATRVAARAATGVPPENSPTSPAPDSPARVPADRKGPHADGGGGTGGGLPLLKDAMTTVMPVAGDPVAETTMFPAARPERPAADDHEEEKPAERSGSWWGPRVVALRPLRGREGYRSVHSDLTRTTTAVIVRGVARTIGEALITLGLVVLLFAAYEVWGKTAIVDAHQQALGGELNQQWTDLTPGAPSTSASAPDGMSDAGVPPGGAIARLYIPKLRKQWVVVQGVTPEDIRYAPGHYPGTAMPGQVGNFSVAGHRIPAIFWDLDRMRSGDAIVVETRTDWYVYQVSQVEIVTPHAVEVVAAVPDHPDRSPTRDDHWLTLTTCNPKWDNYQRLVVHAHLESSQSRSAGEPAVLGG